VGDRRFVDSATFKEKALAHETQGFNVYKQYVLEQAEPEESEERAIIFTISTGVVDRDNDTINPTGWKLDNYLKNPVVLWAHDYDGLPVARALAVWVEGGRLKSRAQFTPRDLYPFGYMVYQLYREGYLRAVSVGFNPLKWQFNEERKFGVDFMEQELLEYSCVPVPANPEALVEARARGIDLAPLKEWAERVLDEWHQERGIWLPRKDVERVFVLLNGGRTFTAVGAVNTGPMQQKGAISYGRAHPDGTPLAPEDEEWDGPAEVAAAEVEDLKVMCAWVDSEKPDIKGSYKLPHHKARGEHACVWRGVAAAMAALLGARGGVDIPDEDRRGVFNHLARHYEEFGKEPPEFKAYRTDDPVELVALIYRCYGIDGDAVARSGRVLSRANEERIRKAVELLQEVLAQLEQEPEQDVAGSSHTAEPEELYVLRLADEETGNEAGLKLNIDAETLKELVRSVVGESIRSITGRVD
jgi:HK97 family phage prohead protease